MFLSNNRFVASCFLAYLLVGFGLLFFHEPWRDELQPWVLIRETTSFSDMLYQSKYEGHPSGWFAILFLITRFTDAFFLAQIIHFFIAAAAVFFILFRSPFSFLEKGFLAFGYFFIYEYALIARNYALGMFFLFAICTLLKNREKNWLLICACFFLLLQANVFAAVLGCALFGVQFLNLGFDLSKSPPMRRPLKISKFLLGSSIFLIGLVVSILDILPPADSSFIPDWKWDAPEWRHALSSFYHAFIPVPKLQLHFWNSHFLSFFLEWQYLQEIEIALAFAILVCCFFSLRKYPVALAFFTLSWLVISVFLSVKYVGFLRHHGHFFLAYVAALWVKKNNEKPVQTKVNKEKLGNIFLIAILCLHVVGSSIAIYFDVKYPFSQSKQAALFIKNNYPPDQLLVGHWDYAASPISFYLRKPIFYPNQNRAATFMEWSSVRFKKEIKNMAKNASTICLEKGAFLLVTNYKVSTKSNKNTSIRLVKIFAPAITKDEEYWLYEVDCAPLK